jgi:hypothetical protein
MKGIYFTLVGRSPKAVANSLAWFLQLKEEVEITDLYFIISDTEEKKVSPDYKIIPRVIKTIDENFQQMELDKNCNITKHPSSCLVIPEADLLSSSELLFENFKRYLDNFDKIFVDVTGGRKTMTASAIIASIYLQNYLQKNGRNTPIELIYYWLKRFTDENKRKKAYQLGSDEIEIKTFSVQEIQQNFERLLKR